MAAHESSVTEMAPVSESAPPALPCSSCGADSCGVLNIEKSELKADASPAATDAPPTVSGSGSGTGSVHDNTSCHRRKQQRPRIPGLTGWVKCAGESALRSVTSIMSTRASVASKLAGLRVWILLLSLMLGRQPVAADMFCGEGGVSHGLALSGWEVRSSDLSRCAEHTRHPRVSFEQRDSLTVPLSGIDFVSASPPCQIHSTAKLMAGSKASTKHLDLMPATRDKLLEAGVPCVIENVMGASQHLRSPYGLCGTMFGLQVARHRLFESSFQWSHLLQCNHSGMCMGSHAKFSKIDRDGNKYTCCSSARAICLVCMAAMVVSMDLWLSGVMPWAITV